MYFRAVAKAILLVPGDYRYCRCFASALTTTTQVKAAVAEQVEERVLLLCPLLLCPVAMAAAMPSTDQRPRSRAVAAEAADAVAAAFLRAA